MIGLVLAADTIGDDVTGTELLLELVLVELGEAPLARDENLLAAGELELGTTESLLCGGDVLGLHANGQQRLTNSDTSDQT